MVRGAHARVRVPSASVRTEVDPRLPAPVFVLGAARSGTSLLFHLLSASAGAWSAYRELHGLYEWDAGLEPRPARGESNFLGAGHATPDVVARIRRALFRAVSNRELLSFPSDWFPGSALWLGRAARVSNWALRRPIQVIDKNPKHSFRVEFLRAVFPDARFVFLYRHARPNIHSLIEGWHSGRFRTYAMAGTAASVARWSFDLPPGWPAWAHEDLPRLCAHQWVGYNRALLDAERALPSETRVRCYYERLVEQPLPEARRIFAHLGLPLSGRALRDAIHPPALNLVSAPARDKWRASDDLLDELRPIFDATLHEIGYADAVTAPPRT
jgi:hypothetical protein